ncbi:MAG TPA: hypothetical protein VE776_11025 [Actinomycetota bacterium]|jgi:hypothetical protein|nr:hypothetical protein [Actinomycetota bacterium]
MHRRYIDALLALAAVLLLAACGSAKSQLGSPTSTTRPDNGVAAKTAADILGDAQRALRNARGVHVVGTLLSQSDAITMDIRLGAGRGHGTVKAEGARLEVLAVNGHTYIRGKKFWRKVGTDDGNARLGDQLANLIGERWVLLSGRRAANPLVGAAKALVDLRTFADQVFADVERARLVKGTRGTVNGQPAFSVDDRQGWLLWVATTGPPFPLRIEAKPGSAAEGKVDFQEYGIAVQVQEPADALDTSKLPG